MISSQGEICVQSVMTQHQEVPAQHNPLRCYYNSQMRAF